MGYTDYMSVALGGFIFELKQLKVIQSAQGLNVTRLLSASLSNALRTLICTRDNRIWE